MGEVKVRMRSVLAVVAAVVVSAFMAGSALAGTATVTDEVAKSDRLHELTITTDAFTDIT